jgi:hypothetical protein
MTIPHHTPIIVEQRSNRLRGPMAPVTVHSSTSVTTPILSDGNNLSIEAQRWRGIILVEPDIDVLTAENLLLTSSNYCVTTASSNDDLFLVRNTKAIALVILSDRLGHSHLDAAARTVRKQWPNSRILVRAQAPFKLEDHLYDEQVCHSSNPSQLLIDLDWFYGGLWNQHSHTLDWSVRRSDLCFARPPISESDPSKASPPPPTEDRCLRGTPSGLRVPLSKRN